MDCFPATFTNIANVDFSNLKQILKKVNICNDNDILKVLLLFENIGLIIREGYTIKKNINFFLED